MGNQISIFGKFMITVNFCKINISAKASGNVFTLPVNFSVSMSSILQGLGNKEVKRECSE